jgi:peptidoglycan-associated lipoprotein
VEPADTGSEFDQGEAPPPPPPPDPEPVSLDLGTAYFDFDRAEIREDAKPTLRANADALQQNTARVTVEGHCDERGDEEYNLALGERRASQVRQYLINLGVDSSQLRIVSYGEAKPATMGHDESAWRWNRRAEFRVE